MTPTVSARSDITMWLTAESCYIHQVRTAVLPYDSTRKYQLQYLVADSWQMLYSPGKNSCTTMWLHQVRTAEIACGWQLTDSVSTRSELICIKYLALSKMDLSLCAVWVRLTRGTMWWACPRTWTPFISCHMTCMEPGSPWSTLQHPSTPPHPGTSSLSTMRKKICYTYLLGFENFIKRK